jgi:hypothetical protein
MIFPSLGLSFPTLFIKAHIERGKIELEAVEGGKGRGE